MRAKHVEISAVVRLPSYDEVEEISRKNPGASAKQILNRLKRPVMLRYTITEEGEEQRVFEVPA